MMLWLVELGYSSCVQPGRSSSSPLVEDSRWSPVLVSTQTPDHKLTLEVASLCCK